MKRKRRIIILAAIIAAGFLLYYQLGKNHGDEKTNIPVSGNIEVTTVDLAFKIPGKIDQLLVDEGDSFKAGRLIATLEHQDLLAQKAKAEATLEASKSRIPSLLKNIQLQDQSTAQEISQAEGAVAAAQARLQQLLAGSRPQEIKAAQAAGSPWPITKKTRRTRGW
ncbi:MAG: biotin/lipoyl-binding protein [Deltaproteobacteria bacterium]|nr:biotin/lipoyl-binding protein [Deltaproteobacteria bacterium]